MDYDAAKQFILNFWTRYLSSWALKALTAFLAAHGAAQENAGNQASAILSGLLAAAVFAADLWHSNASVKQAITNAPNDPPVTGS